MKGERIYVYVDESGQDTAGAFFVVSVLLTKSERDRLIAQLEEIEQRSKKRTLKWQKTKYRYRQAYIEELLNLSWLKNNVFYDTYEGKDYLVNTADATAKAIRHKRARQATIYVDALFGVQLARFRKHLKPSMRTSAMGISFQVRGVRRDENNAFIRLVDAVCGLIRDAEEGEEWSMAAVRKLKRRSIIAKG